MQLSIVAEPNQTFTAALGNAIYQITLKEANGCMVCTVARGNVVVCENVRVMPNQPILPYPYLENGNLFLTTLNDEIPYYTAFGTTQHLFYLTQAEVAALRNGTA